MFPSKQNLQETYECEVDPDEFAVTSHPDERRVFNDG